MPPTGSCFRANCGGRPGFPGGKNCWHPRRRGASFWKWSPTLPGASSNAANSRSGREPFRPRQLRRRWNNPAITPDDFPGYRNLRAQVEAVVHDLNHRPKRLLQGRTSCDLFHDQRRRLRLTKRERTQIFRLLSQAFWRTIGYMPNRTHHQMEAAWRLTVELWLVCHGLISIRLNKNPKVSTNLPKNWSHN